MLITVITVTKNDEARLMSTIKSLKNFYHNDSFEHIIIDALSTDGTENLVNKYRKKYPNITYYSQCDLGIYDGMNKGIALALGDFVLFLNAGDTMAIDAAALFQHLRQLNQEELNIVCFPFIHSWDGMEIVRSPICLQAHKLPTSHQGMLFTSSFIKKNFYDIQYKIASDFDLFHRADQNKILLIQNSMPITVVEGNGFASSNTLKSYVEYMKIIFRKYRRTG